MDYDRLRSSGWTENELLKLRSISTVTTTLDHLVLWLLVVLLALGGVGTGALLVPVMLFAPIAIIPLSLLLGICLGLLLTHALRTLRIPRSYHVRAFLFLSCIMFIASVLTLNGVLLRYDAAQHNVLAICIPLLVGTMLPYLTERRIHGAA